MAVEISFLEKLKFVMFYKGFLSTGFQTLLGALKFKALAPFSPNNFAYAAP